MRIKFVLLFLFLSLGIFAQNGKKTVYESLESLSRMDYVSYFEVTREMFQMLSEVKEANPEYKDYVSKLATLKMVQSQDQSLYAQFMVNTNLKSWSRLITKKEPDSRLSFYKREKEGFVNEFLLVSDEMIIIITGNINLKSIGEFEQIMEVAGSAFDM